MFKKYIINNILLITTCHFLIRWNRSVFTYLIHLIGVLHFFTREYFTHAFPHTTGEEVSMRWTGTALVRGFWVTTSATKAPDLSAPYFAVLRGWYKPKGSMVYFNVTSTYQYWYTPYHRRRELRKSSICCQWSGWSCPPCMHRKWCPRT